MMMEQVMATDMGEHMAIVSKLKSEIQKRMENPDDDIGDDPPEALRILVMQVRACGPCASICVCVWLEWASQATGGRSSCAPQLHAPQPLRPWRRYEGVKSLARGARRAVPRGRKRSV